MKFAIALDAWPSNDIASVALRCRELAYDGLDLAAPASLDDAGVTSVRAALESAEVALVCLATPVLFTSNAKTDNPQTELLKRVIDLAQRLACPLVSLRDVDTRCRLKGSSAVNMLLPLLEPLGCYAMDRNVTLVIENGPTLRTAADAWSLLERLANPAVACCWSLRNADKVGESPSVSIPTLNSRIEHVRFPAIEAGPAAADVALRLAIQRLRGVGYDHYVSVSGMSVGPQSGSGTPPLAAAREKLLNWSSPRPR